LYVRDLPRIFGQCDVGAMRVEGYKRGVLFWRRMARWSAVEARGIGGAGTYYLKWLGGRTGSFQSGGGES
jgi:hypothetical protein